MPNIRVTVNNPTPQRISASSQTRDTVRQIGITSDASVASGTVTSISINTTEGLSRTGSPITISGTITISANGATTAQTGIVRLQDSLLSLNTDQALTANMGRYIASLFDGKVQNTFTISTGNGLVGGGDLTTNRTIVANDASLSVNGVVRLTDVVNSTNTYGAATPNSVNAVYRVAVFANTLAGTVSGAAASIRSGTVNSVSISTGTGLVSSGSPVTDSGTISVSANDASTSVNGVVRLQDSLSSANLGQALTANMGVFITSQLIGKVQNTRTISTTSPLTGGGDLTADRTLAIQAATLTQNGEVRLNDSLTSANLGQALTANMGFLLAQQLIGKTQNTRLISTGFGLTGGGDLTVDRVHGVANASLTTNGLVVLQDSLVSSNLGQALTANMGVFITSQLIGKVQNTTTVSTTSPLSGGGALSSSLTLSIQAASTTQNGEVRLNDTLTSANLGQALSANMGRYLDAKSVPNTRSISTTSPLSGGGALTADLTLAIAAASLTTNGEVRLNDTLTSTNTFQALTANQGRALNRVFSTTYDGLVPANNATNNPAANGQYLLSAAGTWVAPGGGGSGGSGTVTSVTIIAGAGLAQTATQFPLTTAGTYTISANDATLTTNGVVRLQDSLVSSNTGQALTANMGVFITSQFIGKVQNTRTISTTSPLAGGGDLTTDRTLSIQAATLTQNGEVRLNDTLTSANLGQALTANMGFLISQQLIGKVQNTTTVSTTSPLTGGGALSSSLTLAIQAASLTQNGEVRLNDTLTAANLGQALTANMGRYLDAKSVPNTRSISTTSPLAGGGALTSDLTLTIAAATLTTNGEVRLNDTLTSANLGQALTANMGRYLDAKSVPNTRQVLTAGGGVTGGGALTADITIIAANASTSVNGVVRLQDSLTSQNTGQALTANMGFYIVQLEAGKVQNTFTLSTTSPLAGGGDLTTNRTLSIQAATLTQNGEVRLNDSLTSANLGQALTANMGFLVSQQLVGKVQNTTTVSTTSPLTGGGALSSSLTLAIQSATLTQNGEVRLNDTLTSTNTFQALTANQGRALNRVFSTTYDGLVPANNAINNPAANGQYLLSAAGTWVAPGGGGAGSGTVTSVSIIAGQGLVQSGSPITVAGSITVTANDATLTTNGVVRLQDSLTSSNTGQALTANMGVFITSQFIGKVQNTRTISTTSPLAGGGDLTTDRTLSIQAATLTQNGEVRLNDSLTSANLGQALTANMGFLISQQLIGKVQNTTTVSTTSPLTGGGALSSSLTLAIQAATLTQNGEVRLNDTLTSANLGQALTANMGFLISQQLIGKTQNTRTISTTSPLTGGGDLTADRTFAIGAATLVANGEVRLNDTLTSANLGQALTANMGRYMEAKHVSNTRQVLTTSPLSGGGDLTTDRTITITAATLTQNGEVRLNDTLTSANLGQALTANMGFLISQQLIGKVQNTTTISTTSPLTGGGDLTTNRTFAIGAATLVANGEVRLNDTLTSANLGQALTANMGRYLDAKSVPNTRSVLTTSPLAGGGALTADVTLTIGAATLTTNGETRLNDTLASTNTFQALTANQGRALNRVFSTTYDGLVPANNAINNPAANGQYLLSAAGTWVAPGGGGGGGSGTVTSVTVAAGSGLVSSGSPITVSGTITLTANDASTTVNGVVRLNDTITSANLGQALTANMGRFLDAYKVSNTTTISTTAPLTGGGDLSTNRTLAITAATLVQNGEVRLNDTLTSANLGQALTANMGFLISQQLIGKTQNTRTISTTSPLTGGGDLTADRTLAIGAATLTTNGETRLNDTLASANLGQALTANMGRYLDAKSVPNTRSVLTTSPLTGGGALTTDLTIVIGAATLTTNGETRLNDTLASANLGQALTANMGRYLDAKSVPNTRSVLTTGGAITGGGTLATDLTLTVANATTLVNGVVRLQDTLTSQNTGQALTANMGFYVTQLLAGKVQNTFTLSTTSPLAGGGDLTTNRTLTIQAATLTQNGEVRLNDDLTSTNTFQALTANQGRALNRVFSSTYNGLVPTPGTPASKYLRDDGTWQAIAGSGTVTSVDMVVGEGLTETGTPITAAGTIYMNVSIFSATTNGAVPKSVTADGTKYLRDDATWVAVSSTGTSTFDYGMSIAVQRGYYL